MGNSPEIIHFETRAWSWSYLKRFVNKGP